ncbi:MAG: DNA/RNA non-specific endonuclease [Saprospiraceae bacterium]|nr:DNA/RNA non-specific endonuclease [Saprospiraceae bacterium]
MLADFNRDSWAKLEDLFRSYIYRNPETQLYIVTGPVLSDDLPKIPRAQNNVTIPNTFQKSPWILQTIPLPLFYLMLKMKIH